MWFQRLFHIFHQRRNAKTKNYEEFGKWQLNKCEQNERIGCTIIDDRLFSFDQNIDEHLDQKSENTNQIMRSIIIVIISYQFGIFFIYPIKLFVVSSNNACHENLREHFRSNCIFSISLSSSPSPSFNIYLFGCNRSLLQHVIYLVVVCGILY